MSSDSSRVEFSLWELMFIGQNLAVLLAARSRSIVGPTRSDPVGVLGRLRLLQDDLGSLELKRSETIVSGSVEKLITRLEDPDHPSKRLGPQAAEVRALAREVLAALQDEASARNAFVVQRSREGKIEALLRDPAAYFGLVPDGPLPLSAVGISDFQEAGRCYAIGFTAAAIIFILKATEDVLRSYYSAVTRQRASGTWGNLVSILEIPVLKCPKDLIARLKNDLLPKRNAAMHPKARMDVEWNEEAAEQILNECREVIQMMIQDVLARGSAQEAGVS